MVYRESHVVKDVIPPRQARSAESSEDPRPNPLGLAKEIHNKIYHWQQNGAARVLHLATHAHPTGFSSRTNELTRHKYQPNCHKSE